MVPSLALPGQTQAERTNPQCSLAIYDSLLGHLGKEALDPIFDPFCSRKKKNQLERRKADPSCVRELLLGPRHARHHTVILSQLSMAFVCAALNQPKTLKQTHQLECQRKLQGKKEKHASGVEQDGSLPPVRQETQILVFGHCSLYPVPH